MATLMELFTRRVEKQENGCWLWTGPLQKAGYGRFTYRWNGKTRAVMAHRWLYEQTIGPIPDGLTLDHLCRVRACVRPSHLEPVTIRENILRGSGMAARNAKKTHCPYGHPYDKDNTYVTTKKGRQCRTCQRRRLRERYARLGY